MVSLQKKKKKFSITREKSLFFMVQVLHLEKSKSLYIGAVQLIQSILTLIFISQWISKKQFYFKLPNYRGEVTCYLPRSADFLGSEGRTLAHRDNRAQYGQCLVAFFSSHKRRSCAWSGYMQCCILQMLLDFQGILAAVETKSLAVWLWETPVLQD